MSKKSDKYLKVNGHVVRLPKTAYTATIDATAKHNRERTQELADAYLDAREKGLIEEKHETAIPRHLRNIEK